MRRPRKEWYPRKLRPDKITHDPQRMANKIIQMTHEKGGSYIQQFSPWRKD